ncbi:MAG: tetratricopeptide repeat protein [Spirochaetales bacterium]|nr:tetratricopeptide repeat protein [Spirochaetales bacterium]
MKYITTKIKNITVSIPLFILGLLIFSGCSSTADPYNEDLTAKIFFQKAHEASDSQNYSLALDYYKAFQQKYPEDIKGNLWAKFEIAFIYHKQGNDTEAVKLFEALLDEYKAGDSKDYPEAPKILTEKVLAEINQKTTPREDAPPEKS